MSFRFSVGNGTAIRYGKYTILLDPQVSDFTSFISHAHADHSPFGFVTKPYCTEETYELIKLRNPYFEANVVEEDKRIEFDDFTVRLISSGHVLGSVQTFIELDGTSILYTGDFKTSKNLTCRPIKIQEADILIIESTYGSPEYVFEPVENVRIKIIKWVRNQLKSKYSVEIGGYQIGKAQEAVKLLNENGIVPRVSETIRRYCEIYKRFGVKLEYLNNGEDSDVLVKPMHLLNRVIRNNVKTCALTGWVADNSVFGFPLSDHCDFKQIMEYVKEVNPKKVYCIHGFIHELAREIKNRLKIQAQPLENSLQKMLTDF